MSEGLTAHIEGVVGVVVFVVVVVVVLALHGVDVSRNT